MAEKYFPFNSVAGDRDYCAEDFATYFGDIIASGVSANGDNLPVTVSGGLNLLVGPGFAWIRGHLYENTAIKSLSIGTGDSLPRIDRVVVRLMVAERKIETIVIQGTPSANPSPAALIRTGDYFDIGLAEINVPASAISITNSNIKDTRTDNAVCGAVRTLIETLDVGAFMRNSRADFEAWLANLQYVLDGDVAGHLQNGIDRLRKDVADGVYATHAAVNLLTVPGAAVTMTMGDIELITTADASGRAFLKPRVLGTYALKVVTKNATYTETVNVNVIGIFDISLPTFATMSWADIDAVGRIGAAASVFKRGDEKNVNLNKRGPTTMRIEDFNHDDLPGGGKANITIAMKDLFGVVETMNPTNTNTGSWNASAMRARMTEYFSQLPEDLQTVIKPVVKKTTEGNQSTSIQNTTDSLWLFSIKEAGLLPTAAGHIEEGEPYPLFVNNASRIKKSGDGDGGAINWWTRSPNTQDSNTFVVVTASGTLNHYGASDSYGACLGFCV